MPGQYIHVGLGASAVTDVLAAARAAATQALNQCGKRPNFSIVYIRSDVDPSQILRGITSVLGSEWIGISTDKMFSSTGAYDAQQTVSVLCIASDYLHFGVSVANNYRKDPKKAAQQAVQEAIKHCKADKHLDAYVQFTRAKVKDYASIIRTPPYFLMTYMSGVKFNKGEPVPGHEAEFVSGILEYTGPHIPMFGGSASSSLEEYTNNKGDNFQIAQGKVYKDAAIVVFVVSDLKFSTVVSHGYDSTNEFAAVTKLDDKGYRILELNGKEPVAEYARLLGLTKAQFLKDPATHSFNRPFGLIQGDGTTFIKEVIVNKDNKTLQSNFKLHKNSILNVLKFNSKETLQTLPHMMEAMHKKGDKIALAAFCSCSGRRPLIPKIETKEVSALRKAFPTLPFFGFYSFSEVGSTDSTSAQSHSQTITALTIFDELLTE